MKRKTEAKEKKTVLLTGAFGGMGKAVRTLLVSEGFDVIACDCRVPAEEKEADVFEADVTDLQSLDRVFRQLKEENTELDAIVNLAGVYDFNSLVEIPEDRFLNIFNINLFGVYRVNKVFLPLLKPHSRIVVVSSELAPLKMLPFTGLYGITKAAAEEYAYALRMELQLIGHSVSVIRPGAVRTALLDVSMQRIQAFRDNTQLYRENAERYLALIRKIETSNIEPRRIAEVVLKALSAGRPKFVYNINRNFLLRVFNLFPARFQCFVIKKFLQGPSGSGGKKN